MDECAICGMPDEHPIYFETEWLNPEDRRAYAVCRDCADAIAEQRALAVARLRIAKREQEGR